ncbi:MAG: hypothetical protein EBR82_27465 [Caulobacteraceae bacterium]|nr:hypothetical protein [Caulobacteraceae bacterium]
MWVNITPDCGSITGDVTNTVCTNLVGFRSIQRQQLDRNQFIETEWLTTFRYGVGCFQGSYLFDQMATQRQYGLGCPRDGAILSRRHVITQADYSIRTIARDNCDPSACNGFQTPDQMQVTLPLAPLPIEGALGFF